MKSMMPTFRSSAVKHKPLWCLGPCGVQHRKLRIGTDGLTLIEILELIHTCVYLFHHYYSLLNNVQSIRKLLILEDSKCRVGHLYKEPNFLWWRSEKICNGIHYIIAEVIHWISYLTFQIHKLPKKKTHKTHIRNINGLTTLRCSYNLKRRDLDLRHILRIKIQNRPKLDSVSNCLTQNLLRRLSIAFT